MADLYLREIAERLAQLLGEIKQMDVRVRVLEDSREIAGEPEIPCAGMTSPLSPFVFYPVKVTSISTVSSLFYARRIVPDATGWTEDTVLTTPITIAVPSNISYPAVDDIVRADFTGTYGAAFNPRYGLFDRVRPDRVGFVLTADMSGGEATAKILPTWDSASETYIGSVAGVVVDTRGIFTDATSGLSGLGYYRTGNGRDIVEPVNMECPP